MKNYEVVIRNDDVLQDTLWSKQGRKFLRGGVTPFELFLKADKAFEKHQYPCILAVLSEGIDKFPEWVEHIKKNKHRYIIELHGSSHFYYCDLTEEEGYKELKMAKEKIESTFDIKISTWYVTFGRKKAPEWGQRVCDRLGIKYDIPNTKRDAQLWMTNYYKKERYPFFHINFHFWYPPQVEGIKEVIEIICQKDYKDSNKKIN